MYERQSRVPGDIVGIGGGFRSICGRFGIKQKENALSYKIEEKEIGYRNFYTLGGWGRHVLSHL